MTQTSSPKTGETGAVLNIASTDPSILTAGDNSSNVYTITLVISGTPALPAS